MTDPPDLSSWGLHCYCPEARRTPHGLVAASDNGKTLYAARTGATQEQLGATDFHLEALEQAGLLERDGDRYVTSFPVIGSTDMTVLRAELRELARSLVPAIATHSRRIAAELDRRGIGQSAYALTFGYGLDLLLWEPLKAGGLLPDTALTPERPDWNGAFWAIHPPRADSGGTNFLDCGEGVTLVMIWSDATASALDRFAMTPGIRDALRELADDDLAPRSHRGSASSSMPWPLWLPDGRPGLPVVGTRGVLDDLARQVAAPVIAVLAGDGANSARRLVPTQDRAVATVVVAHELIWEVAEQLIATGACPAPASAADLTSHLFLLAT